MNQRFRKASVLVTVGFLFAACSNADLLEPGFESFGEEIQAAVAEASAPPIAGLPDIISGTIVGADGTVMNAIAVHIIGNRDNGSHNAFRVVAWVPAADTTQKPPFDQLLRVGVRTRGSAEAPIGVEVPIARFDFESEQQAFGYFKQVGERTKWVADSGQVTIATLEITTEATACELPEGIEVECTVATGMASGTFEFTASPFRSDSEDVFVQPLTTFDLPVVQLTVAGGFGWRGFRKGHGRGCGWGFGD